ncbi:hypothetical protein FF38_07407 [Lucilia cuprina]|uniref:Uncharacterized protein n=1 Tax=Lucilia cuprina TaxID=7375 RepID=A0A0L0BQA2_LUCCU|nr:hypothetical protein FF38_07407 [Lucilia cuprina]
MSQSGPCHQSLFSLKSEATLFATKVFQLHGGFRNQARTIVESDHKYTLYVFNLKLGITLFTKLAQRTAPHNPKRGKDGFLTGATFVLPISRFT